LRGVFQSQSHKEDKTACPLSKINCPSTIGYCPPRPGPPPDAITFGVHDFVLVTSTAPKFNPVLIEKAQDFACDVLPARLLVIHDASRCGEHDEAELTGWKKLDDPFLKVRELDVVSWADNTGLVDAAVELDDDLAVAMIVNLLEFADVAVALHDGEELGNDLGRGSDHDLALA